MNLRVRRVMCACIHIKAPDILTESERALYLFVCASNLSKNRYSLFGLMQLTESRRLILAFAP